MPGLCQVASVIGVGTLVQDGNGFVAFRTGAWAAQVGAITRDLDSIDVGEK